MKEHCASSKIQRWFRMIHLENPLRFTSNFKDVDILTLNKIRHLTLHQCFFLTVPNGDIHACEAVSWLQYFIRHGTLHPMTKCTIENEDVWACFFKARQLLPSHSKLIEACHSINVIATMKEREKVVKLVPKSPLYRLQIVNVIDISRNKKNVHYQLADSRAAGALVDPRTFHVEIKSSLDFMVEFTF